MRRIVAIGVLLAVAALGVQLLAARAVRAQTPPPGYTECFAVSLWAVQGRELNEGELPKKRVKVPAGWTPVGGTVVGAGSAANPGMVLCR